MPIEAGHAFRHRAGRFMPGILPLLLACVPEGAPLPNSAAAQDTGYVMQRVAGNAVVLPKGFEIGVFADRLDGPRFMAAGPDGAVYVTETGPGRVRRLMDHDGDGKADETTTVAEGLRHPHGITFRGDTLYIAEEHRVVRFRPPYRDAEVVIEGLPAGGGHFTRTILFRGDEMFVSIGSSCNLCKERDVRRAAVIRYRPDGTGETIYATGLRNSVGLAVHPTTGDLWATNNDRDRLGDDLPPDRVNILFEGGFYGWPQCYLPGMPNPEYRNSTASCDSAIGPAVRLPAHTAPLGLTFYTATQFPPEYRGDLFVALHGSWDRSFPIGYEVVRISIVDGRPTGELHDFVSGWQVGRRWWGRPVDVLVAPDGSLLISDDHGGRIFRVWHTAAE